MVNSVTTYYCTCPPVSRTLNRGQKNLTRPVFSSYSNTDVAIRVSLLILEPIHIHVFEFSNYMYVYTYNTYYRNVVSSKKDLLKLKSFNER